MSKLKVSLVFGSEMNDLGRINDGLALLVKQGYQTKELLERMILRE